MTRRLTFSQILQGLDYDLLILGKHDWNVAYALATTFAVEWTLYGWAYNKFWESVYSVKALPYAVHRVCLVYWEVVMVIQLWLFPVIIGILSL